MLFCLCVFVMIFWHCVVVFFPENAGNLKRKGFLIDARTTLKDDGMADTC